jgi:hypothetical protein
MKSDTANMFSILVKAAIKFSAAISLAGLTISFGMVGSLLITSAAIQRDGNAELFSQLYSILRMTFSLGGLFFMGAFFALLAYVMHSYIRNDSLSLLYALFLFTSATINIIVIKNVLVGARDLGEKLRMAGNVTVDGTADINPPLDFLMNHLDPTTQHPVVTFISVMLVSVLIILMLARKDILALWESRARNRPSSS